MAIQRIALGVEYDGSGFSGWQAQRSPQVPTVQEALESALTRVADEPVTVHCAGRTDAGVHALAQVVHFDTAAERSARAWVLGTNSMLPGAIAVQWAEQVDAGFHARFSAQFRRYRYLVLNRSERSALLYGRVCLQRQPLDAAVMHDAAQLLLGEQDFSAFRAAGCQSRSAMRRMDRIDVNRHGDMIIIDVQANAFLLHMVRNIVGALMAVGSAERDSEWLHAVLHSRDRSLCAATAPAAGLYLVAVGYAAHWGLPAPGSLTWSLA